MHFKHIPILHPATLLFKQEKMKESLITRELARIEQEFSIELVSTPEQLQEVFQLRHQVYCTERGFEDSENGEETDAYDLNARHALLRSNADGTVIGTVRMILPNLVDLEHSFPMQELCDPALLAHLPLKTTGEMSRFCLSKQRRMGLNAVMHMRLLLWRGILELSVEAGLTHWLAVVEPSNIRLHARSSIFFEPVGPLVEFHKLRQPMTGIIKPVLAEIKLKAFPVWYLITDGGRLDP